MYSDSSGSDATAAGKDEPNLTALMAFVYLYIFFPPATSEIEIVPEKFWLNIGCAVVVDDSVAQPRNAPRDSIDSLPSRLDDARIYGGETDTDEATDCVTRPHQKQSKQILSLSPTFKWQSSFLAFYLDIYSFGQLVEYFRTL